MSPRHAIKILSRKEAADVMRRHRGDGEVTVFTNGCFDILHRGHVELLLWAKRQGDILVVGLNSDESVSRLKGPTRPVNNQNDRAVVLAALECVDYVTMFSEDTPTAVIDQLLPAVLVKGGDYSDITKIVGYDTVIRRGGLVLTAPFHEGYSSTRILTKLDSSQPQKEGAPTCFG